MPQIPSSQNRTLVRHLVSLLYFGKNANLTKLRIKQQEHTLRCQLNFAARDLRDRATVLCVLTYPLILLSKPVSPKLDKAAKLQKNTKQKLSITHCLSLITHLFWACPSPVLSHFSGRALRYNLSFFSQRLRRREKKERISTAIPHAEILCIRKILTNMKFPFSKKILKPVKVG